MKKIILIVVFSLIIIYFGISQRLLTNIYNPREFYAKNNVASYYADITNRFITDGKIVKLDKWRYSNAVLPENAPPFLAIFTNSIYQLVKPFGIVTLTFIAYFNIVIYVLFIVVGSIYLYRKFISVYPVVIFQLLLSFLPFSIYLQNFGRYTEEFLGVFLIFLISICEIEREGNRYWKYFETLLLIFLLLTWQQFHIVCFILFVSNLLFRRFLVKETILIILFAFLVAEVASRYILMSNYSPIYMIYESIYPLLYSNNKVILIAMRRTDWKYLSWSSAIGYFSYAGISIWFISLLNYVFKKNKSYLDNYIFVGMLLTLILMTIFVKGRYIFIPYLLLFCSFNYQLFIIENIKQLFRVVKAIGILIVISIIIFLIANQQLFINYGYNPLVNNQFTTIKLADGKTRATLTLKNTGGDQTPDSTSFAGYHVEVFNAKVTNIKSEYSTGKTQVIIKPDSQMKNYYWFEVKYFGLGKDKSAKIMFDLEKIEPTKNFDIKYRSWIPGYCSVFDRFETMSGMLQEYSQFSNSWRNEKCIIRSPINDDANEKDCSYKVYAAHVNRQLLKCYEKSF